MTKPGDPNKISETGMRETVTEADRLLDEQLPDETGHPDFDLVETYIEPDGLPSDLLAFMRKL